MSELFYPILDVRCPECVSRGFKPTLLARIQGVDGKLFLWCKNCKKEIKVIVHETKIEFEP